MDYNFTKNNLFIPKLLEALTMLLLFFSTISPKICGKNSNSEGYPVEHLLK